MTELKLVPAGYMAKRIIRNPDWIKANPVVDIYSVSSHMSQAFADYINYWQHNGWWLFDNPDIIAALIQEHSLDAKGLTYFYYETTDHEYYREDKSWRLITTNTDFPIKVRTPETKTLVGFDVVTFLSHNTPECSPLSCNNLASTLPTTRHCLFESFAEAKAQIEQGRFDDTEPGPLRIIAVYTLADTQQLADRLRFRSHHRGTKEMDLLLGSFAAKHLDRFGVTELAEYEALLTEQDQDLYDWLAGRSAPPTDKLTPILSLFLQHKLVR